MGDSDYARQAKRVASHPCATLALIIFLVFDVAMLIVGLVHRKECPIDPKIPLYLIVAGAVGLGAKLLHILNRKLEWCLINLICFVIYIGEIVWICLGSYWVYKVYKPNFIPGSGDDYCKEVAYMLSFWFITVHWIMLAISIFLSCCCCCCPNCTKWCDWRRS